MNERGIHMCVEREYRSFNGHMLYLDCVIPFFLTCCIWGLSSFMCVFMRIPLIERIHTSGVCPPVSRLYVNKLTHFWWWTKRESICVERERSSSPVVLTLSPIYFYCEYDYQHTHTQQVPPSISGRLWVWVWWTCLSKISGISGTIVSISGRVWVLQYKK